MGENMKKFKAVKVIGLLTVSLMMSGLSACSCGQAITDSVDEACDTVEDMAAQKGEAQKAVDASHEADRQIEADLDAVFGE